MIRRTLGAACGLLLVAAGTAGAQTPNGQNDLTGLGAAVNIGYYQTKFAYDNGTYTSDLTEVGLALGEHFTPGFSMWLGAGYAQLVQNSNPAQGNFTPSGYYARVGANYHLPLISNSFGLDFTASSDYHHVSDSNNNTDLTQHWVGYSGAVGPWFRSGSIAFEAGLVYRHASGTEDRTGKNPTSQSFGYDQSTNPYFDVSFHLQPDAAVRLHVEGGAWQGATLSFSYNFSSL